MPSVKISTGFSELLPVKNIAGVIKAVGEMGGMREVWVVGDGKERKNLEKLAKKLEVKTKFWGRVTNQKAREIMRASDVFVLNSFHEGMPHALIEALAEGVPVIATKIPAVLEVLTGRKTGLLINIDDSKDLTRAIKELREVKGLKKRLVRNGKELFQKKFTWESHLEQLYNVFYEVVDRTNFGFGPVSPSL